MMGLRRQEVLNGMETCYRGIGDDDVGDQLMRMSQ